MSAISHSCGENLASIDSYLVPPLVELQVHRACGRVLRVGLALTRHLAGLDEEVHHNAHISHVTF